MATLSTQLTQLVTRIGTEFKGVYTKQGNLASLSTAQKASLVDAINEVSSKVAQAGAINDAAATSTNTYSAEKVQAELAALEARILGSSSLKESLDTLKEIADFAESNKSLIDTINDAMNKRVAVTAQTFTEAEKTQARTNIGVDVAIADAVAVETAARSAAIAQLRTDMGDHETDFVALFNSSLL